MTPFTIIQVMNEMMAAPLYSSGSFGMKPAYPRSSPRPLASTPTTQRWLGRRHRPHTQHSSCHPLSTVYYMYLTSSKSRAFRQYLLRWLMALNTPRRACTTRGRALVAAQQFSLTTSALQCVQIIPHETSSAAENKEPDGPSASVATAAPCRSH